MLGADYSLHHEEVDKVEKDSPYVNKDLSGDTQAYTRWIDSPCDANAECHEPNPAETFADTVNIHPFKRQ